MAATQVEVEEEIELATDAPVAPDSCRRLLQTLRRRPKEAGCRRLIQSDQLNFATGRACCRRRDRSWRGPRGFRVRRGAARSWHGHRDGLFPGRRGRAAYRRWW